MDEVSGARTIDIADPVKPLKQQKERESVTTLRHSLVRSSVRESHCSGYNDVDKMAGALGEPLGPIQIKEIADSIVSLDFVALDGFLAAALQDGNIKERAILCDSLFTQLMSKYSDLSSPTARERLLMIIYKCFNHVASKGNVVFDLDLQKRIVAFLLTAKNIPETR